MKKIFAVLILIFSCMISTSCNLFSDAGFLDGDHKSCDKLVEDLTTLLYEEDNESLKELFAPLLIKNISTFDKDLQDLINYYDGKVVRIGGRVDTGEYSNWDYEEKHHSMEYTVVTDIDTFRFAIHYVVKDSRSKYNIGINCLYVLKLSEDEYPNERYTGELISKVGIHVAFPHIHLEE